MKRVFCDSCGKEFAYDSVHGKVNGSATAFSFPINRENELSYTFTHVKGVMKITFEFDRIPNGAHIDICVDCRWAAIDKLDPRPHKAPDEKYTNVTNPHREGF